MNNEDVNKKRKITRRKRITKVNVPPKTYKVKRKNKVVIGKEKKQVDGYCDDVKSEICLDKSLSISSDKVILLHEILHAIYNCNSPDICTKAEESVIVKITPGLIRVLRENKNLVRYIMEEDE